MATEIGGMKNGSRLLSILLKASEKAANIARTCRKNEALFSMLVQEKSAEEKNPRFFQDFKTLADVLIQETIRHDIEVEFPELSTAVQGEESNTFSNSLGETITVEVCSTLEETSELLAKVMGDDPMAAELLAVEVHKDIQLGDVPMSKEIPEDISVNINDLGIWVDPIDSTADYINGIDMVDTSTGLNVSGFRCITVLIGVYQKSTNLPIVGVVNQPFYTNVDMQWKGSCNWGFVMNGNSACSINREDSTNKIVALSRDEDSHVKAALSNGGRICFVKGFDL
ncbi:hypothetical protein KM043_006713 [Ampulex compressa]|nr:hypothetical protein KM043_006713 [Ampulex compressa]